MNLALILGDVVSTHAAVEIVVLAVGAVMTVLGSLASYRILKGLRAPELNFKAAQTARLDAESWESRFRSLEGQMKENDERHTKEAADLRRLYEQEHLAHIESQKEVAALNAKLTLMKELGMTDGAHSSLSAKLETKFDEQAELLTRILEAVRYPAAVATASAMHPTDQEIAEKPRPKARAKKRTSVS